MTMSFRNRGFAGRASPRVSQIFKKRNELFTVAVPSGSDATLLATTTLDETGTLYAVKVSCFLSHVAGTAPDTQRVPIWIRCVPAGTPLPDLTSEPEMDTLNGFPAAVLFGHDGVSRGPSNYLNEKFRFRRKCDANMVVQLIAQSTSTEGTGRTCEISGLMSLIIRIR